MFDTFLFNACTGRVWVGWPVCIWDLRLEATRSQNEPSWADSQHCLTISDHRNRCMCWTYNIYKSPRISENIKNWMRPECYGCSGEEERHGCCCCCCCCCFSVSIADMQWTADILHPVCANPSSIGTTGPLDSFNPWTCYNACSQQCRHFVLLSWQALLPRLRGVWLLSVRFSQRVAWKQRWMQGYAVDHFNLLLGIHPCLGVYLFRS